MPAIVSILVTRRNQRLGDLAAGTLVIREPRPARRPPRARRARAAPATAGLRLADWDVSAITPQELAAVRSFLDAPRRVHAATRAAGSRATWPSGSAPRSPASRPGSPAETLLEGIAAAKSARS